MSAITDPVADPTLPAAIPPAQLTLVRRLQGQSQRGRPMLHYAFSGPRMPRDLGGLLLTLSRVFQEQGINPGFSYDVDAFIYKIAGVLNIDVVFNVETTLGDLPDLEILVRRVCEAQIAAEAA